MRPLLVALALAPAALAAQTRVTRADAVAAALARGPRVSLARADSAAGRAGVKEARAFPNPSLSATYTKAIPRYHAILDLPLDWPWLRGPRVGAAEAASTAALDRYALERAVARFEAETTYTRALATAAHARLSRRNALDAATLLRMAVLRRDAGDASEMDVRLARINAGQLENQAADDSLGALAALLDLQQVMGLPGDSAHLVLSDTLALPPPPPPPPDSAAAGGVPLDPPTAAPSLRASERTLTLARASNIPSPSIQLGVESGDPTGAEPGSLPTVGIAVALPLFNQNGGAIARATAERDRATAELALARRTSDAAIARAERERELAEGKVARDVRLLAGADSVAAMFLAAYAEGAVSLPNVLEAQRNARDALARYVDDLAAAHTAHDAWRVVTTTERLP